LNQQLATQKQLTAQLVGKLNDNKSQVARDLSQIQEQLNSKSEEAEKW
jgi:ribosomal protein L10